MRWSSRSGLLVGVAVLLTVLYLVYCTLTGTVFWSVRWAGTGTVQDIHNAINARVDRQILLNLSREYVAKNKDFIIKPWEIKPLAEYRSHCWQESKRVRCLPSFFLAGMMKSGTTDLWYHIIKHPQMVGQYDIKEPLWWGQNRIHSDRSKLSDRGVQFTTKTNKFYKIPMSEYLDNFGSGRQLSDPGQEIGDGSGTTLKHNTVMRDFIHLSEWTEKPSQPLRTALDDLRLQPSYLAYQFTPHAKFLVILRDPVERLFSQYMSEYKRKEENPTKSHFHAIVLREMMGFRWCLLKGLGIRYCVYDKRFRLSEGFYVIYISDLLKVVPREHVLILNFHEYRKDRGVTLKRVFQFLGVQHDDKLISHLKQGKVANSHIDHNTDIGPMWDTTRRILKDMYRPFNQELAIFLNDSRFLFD